MLTLLDEVKQIPVRRVSEDWFHRLSAQDQWDIVELLKLKHRDESAVPHSFLQLAQIVVRRYDLKCKENYVRMTLTRMYRECQEPKASRKK